MAIEITKKIVRNSLRLKGYDYSQPGAYFVTICTENRICYLGNIVDGIMISFPISDIVRKIWLEIPEKFQCVELDAIIIMPNHVHGVVIINKECRRLIHKTDIKDCTSGLKVGLINQAPTMNQAPTVDQMPTNNYKNDNSSQAGKGWILAQKSEIAVGKIIRYFKAKSTKIIHDNCFPRFQWQRNYYEHVVRSTKELNSIREYIINNPIKWALDRENRQSKNFNMNLDYYFKDIFQK